MRDLKANITCFNLRYEKNNDEGFDEDEKVLFQIRQIHKALGLVIPSVELMKRFIDLRNKPSLAENLDKDASFLIYLDMSIKCGLEIILVHEPSTDKLLQSQQDLKRLCLHFITQFKTHFSPVDKYFERDAFFVKNSGICLDIVKWIRSGFTTLLTLSQDNPELVELPVALLRIIRILSRSEVLSRDMNNDPVRIIQFISAQLREPSADSQIITECCAILANGSSIPFIRSEIVASGSLDIIIQYLATSTNATTEAEICAALANLAAYDDSCKVIVHSGGMRIFEGLLRRHRNNVEIAIQVFHVLTNMSRHGKGSANEDSLLEVIYQTTLRHEHDAEVVRSALNAIGSLAFSRYYFGRWREKLSELILRMYLVYGNSPTFVISCCFAIAHMSYGSEFSMEMFQKYRAIELILNSMKQFELHRAVQTTACFALGSVLLHREDIQTEFIRLNGAQLLFSSMQRTYPDSALYQQSKAQRVVTSCLVTNRSGSSTSIDVDESEDQIQLEEPLLRQNSRVSFESTSEEMEWELSNGDDDRSARDIEEDSEAQIVIVEPTDSLDISANNNRGDKNSLAGTKSLHKEHLLLMFAGVVLLNLGENQKIKEQLLNMGVVHFIYKAAEKIQDIAELGFILSHLFLRYTNLVYSYAYIKPHIVPTLSELCCQAIVQHEFSEKTSVTSQIHDDNPITRLMDRTASMLSTVSAFLRPTDQQTITASSKSMKALLEMKRNIREEIEDPKERLEELCDTENLSQHCRTLLNEYKKCQTCSIPCYKSKSVRMYQMGLTDKLSHTYCSEECARSFEWSSPLHSSLQRTFEIKQVNIDTDYLFK